MCESSYEREEFDRTKRAISLAWDSYWSQSNYERSLMNGCPIDLKCAWEDFQEAAAGPLEYYELGCEIEIEREVLRQGLQDIAGAALRDKTADELRAIAAKVLEDSTK